MVQAQAENVRRVTLDVDGPIAWLWIENGARMNAMSFSMWRELAAHLERLDAEPDVRAIVIAGRGGKAFCAGGDISEFSAFRVGSDAMQSYDAVGKAAMNGLAGCGKVTIAMIDGYCLGGGFALALRCDLRIAAHSAKLGIPAAKRGLSYDYDSIRRLVDLIGPSNTKHVLYSGRSYAVADTVVQGFVNEVVPAGELHDHVAELASLIVGNAPLSLSASKLIVDMATRDPDQRDLDACAAAERRCLSSEDYLEATRAFMEKRQPRFVGR